MSKDYGIVFIPNIESVYFVNYMTRIIADKLPGYKQALNIPHITAYHIANVNAAQ